MAIEWKQICAQSLKWVQDLPVLFLQSLDRSLLPRMQLIIYFLQQSSA